MVVFGSLIVSLIITLISYFRNPKEYKWWEFLLVTVVVLGVSFGANAIAKKSGVMFTEYWGETVTAVYVQEPYNEWVTKTCSETYACGSHTDANGNSVTDYCTRYYDCSYQNDEGPSWWCTTDIGNQYNISEHLYDSLVGVYNTNLQQFNRIKNYAPRDRAEYSRDTKYENTVVGTYSYSYKCAWPGTDETRKGIFTKHRYENRMKASDLTMFNIPVVDEVEADSMKLFKYPEDIDKFNCPVILGGNVSPETQEEFRKLNAKFGPSNRMRLWVLVYDDLPPITANYQENYWVRGNLNELVVCIGKSGDEVTWSYAFSWGLNGTLTAEAATKVLELYEYTVTSSEGQTLPIAIPIVNKEMKELVSDVTGIDAKSLPPVIPLPFNRDKVTKSVKSKTPILNDRTWHELYNYLNANLDKYEKRSHEEFSYIKVKLKTWVIVLIYILSAGLSIVLNIFMSSNDHHDKGTTRNTSRYGRHGY